MNANASKYLPASPPGAPRVLLVLNRYRPMIGGAERQCELLCEKLAGRVNWMALFTHRYKAELPQQEQIAGVNVHRLGRPVGPGGRAPLSFYVDVAWSMLRMRHQFDLVHCHTCGFTGIWVASIGRLLGKPVLLKLTAEGELAQQVSPSGLPSSVLSRLKGAVRRVFARMAIEAVDTHVVALTLGGGREASTCGVRNVHVIPNGVDARKYAREPRNGPTESGRIRFGYCGRLTAEKGTHVLANAFEDLFPRHANISLHIAGSGDRQLQSSEEKLRELAQQWNGAVHLVGSISDTAVFLAGLDVYVSASTYEGLPNAVLEALATGLPCVLSNVDAHREIARLNPQAKIFFFEPENVKACVSAVESVIAKWPCSGSVLSADLDMPHIAKSYLGLYKKILTSV